MDFLEDLPLDVSWLVGLAVFLGIVSISALLTRRRRPKGPLLQAAAPLVYGYGRGAAKGQAMTDAAPMRGHSDRRVSLRRTGAVVQVAVADARKEGIEPGWVVDRSMGGLGLHLNGPLQPGTILNVRPWDAGAMAPWVEVTVRNCWKEDDSWKVGCQFARTPPWSVLLLFG